MSVSLSPAAATHMSFSLVLRLLKNTTFGRLCSCLISAVLYSSFFIKRVNTWTLPVSCLTAFPDYAHRTSSNRLPRETRSSSLHVPLGSISCSVESVLLHSVLPSYHIPSYCPAMPSRTELSVSRRAYMESISNIVLVILSSSAAGSQYAVRFFCQEALPPATS